jgi:hypothetical protein
MRFNRSMIVASLKLNDWLLNYCWPSLAHWSFVPCHTWHITKFYYLDGLGAFFVLAVKECKIMLIQARVVNLDSESHGTHTVTFWRCWEPHAALLNKAQKCNCASQETHYVSATLLKQSVLLYCESHMKQTYRLGRLQSFIEIKMVVVYA